MQNVLSCHLNKPRKGSIRGKCHTSSISSFLALLGSNPGWKAAQDRGPPLASYSADANCPPPLLCETRCPMTCTSVPGVRSPLTKKVQMLSTNWFQLFVGSCLNCVMWEASASIPWERTVGDRAGLCPQPPQNFQANTPLSPDAGLPDPGLSTCLTRGKRICFWRDKARLALLSGTRTFIIPAISIPSCQYPAGRGDKLGCWTSKSLPLGGQNRLRGV